MKNYEENEKSNRRKSFQSKKINKQFIDEDQFFQKKLNKEFKHRKKNMIDEDEDWKDWQNYDLKN